MADRLKWPVGHVYLLSDSQEELAPTNLWRLDRPELHEPFRDVTRVTRFAPLLGMPGRILSSGEPLWIPDVPQDSNFPRIRIAKETGIRAGFGVPLKVGEDVAGVMEFFCGEVLPPDEERLAHMTSAAVQMGRVIERRTNETLLLAAQREKARLEEMLQKMQTLSPEVHHHLQTVYSALEFFGEDAARRDPLSRRNQKQLKKAADRIADLVMQISLESRIR